MAWRYIAQRLNGDGTETNLDLELPLRSVQITDVLSGPPRLTGELSPEFSRLIGDDQQPIIKRWSTAIYAEADGVIRLGTIVDNIDMQGPTMSLDCIGFSGYPQGMPYTDSWFGVEIDPLDVVRHIWNHLQSKPDGHIGLAVDTTTHTPIKLGTELTQDEYDTQYGGGTFESGPVQLNWYSTDDLGRVIDDLAASTPFDYHEKHYWNGDDISHVLDFGYPRIGARREDLRFALGENVFVMPSVNSAGDEYANQIMALGAGEGRDMLRSLVGKRDGGVRRVKVVTDKSLRQVPLLTTLARGMLSRAQAPYDVTELEVRDHPHAAISSIHPGDEILLFGDTGYAKLNLWLRVLSVTIEPESGNAARLTVMRTDKVGT
jgi:hypothetical protein